MPRKQLLQALAGCGARNDRQSFTRMFICNRISRKAADEAWRRGVNLRRFCEQRDAKKVSDVNPSSTLIR